MRDYVELWTPEGMNVVCDAIPLDVTVPAGSVWHKRIHFTLRHSVGSDNIHRMLEIAKASREVFPDPVVVPSR